MNVLTFRTWIAFKSIIQHFLGNHRSAYYENLLDELMDCMKILGSSISNKMHFLRSLLDYIPSSFYDFSEKQLSLRRVLSPGYYYNERYQGKWDVNMRTTISDYCWCLKRDDINAKHKKKAINSHLYNI